MTDYEARTRVWDPRTETWRDAWKPVTMKTIREWYDQDDRAPYTDLAGFIEFELLNGNLREAAQ